jgi:hypothetical protein
MRSFKKLIYFDGPHPNPLPDYRERGNGRDEYMDSA